MILGKNPSRGDLLKFKDQLLLVFQSQEEIIFLDTLVVRLASNP